MTKQITSVIERQGDRASFKRLATKRTNAALKYLRLIGNLSNKANYAYSPADVKKIFAVLREALDEAEGRFNQKPKTVFNLEA